MALLKRVSKIYMEKKLLLTQEDHVADIAIDAPNSRLESKLLGKKPHKQNKYRLSCVSSSQDAGSFNLMPDFQLSSELYCSNI